ncbi:ABC transporter F family member 4 [Fundulus heteroclitus]|uniref:ABC transporter F family member 4 n=1 Tax=Fundulus heteroclitus TaxID=8078 RepID=UPI00165C04AD|nr:ABC transporter F family member 4 [Fundulus heteroclitus]
MGSEEDAALLALIHRHLEASGYREAAQRLEEHLTQVEMPVEGLNLHDIYTGWIKLCSLAQHAKQETRAEYGNLKMRMIKQEEEEAADVKLNGAAGEKRTDDKPLIEPKTEVLSAETAIVSEQHLEAADKTQTEKSDSESSDSEVEEEEKEKTSTDTEPVPAEAPNEGEGSGSDTERTSEPTQSDPDVIDPSQPETQPRPSDPAEESSPESEQEEEEEEEDQQGGDEEEQETQAVINSPEATEETSASERIDAVQGSTACSSQEANVAELLEEEEEEEEEEHTAAEGLSHAHDVSNQEAEREAPPPAGADVESPQETRSEVMQSCIFRRTFV